jgi:hypothetical protein
MEIDRKSDQIFEWMESNHRMQIGLMLFSGLISGAFMWQLFDKLWLLPICFFASFVYPLCENIKRKIQRRRKTNEQSAN